MLGAGFAARPRVLEMAILVQIVFWSILPDLLDKPIFLLGLAPAMTGRLWGHTLLASTLCCLLCRFRLPSAWPWVLAMPGHLVLDGLWRRPHTLFWPFLGQRFDTHPFPIDFASQGYLGLWRWRLAHDLPFFLLELGFELIGLFLTIKAFHLAATHHVLEERIGIVK